MEDVGEVRGWNRRHKFLFGGNERAIRGRVYWGPTQGHLFTTDPHSRSTTTHKASSKNHGHWCVCQLPC